MSCFHWKTSKSLEGAVKLISSGVSAVNLAGFQLTDSDVAKIALILKSSKTLKALNLSATNLGESGIEAVVQSLLSNETLVHISLDHNSLGKQGGEAVKRLLEQNDVIASMHLSNTKLGDEGAHEIADGMRNNLSILALEIMFTEVFDDDIYNDIESMLERNNKLAFETYLKNCGKNGKVPWKRSKLMICGQGCSGKTATARSLLGKPFDSAWKTTVGISLSLTYAQISDNVGWCEEKVLEKSSSNLALELGATFAASESFIRRKAANKANQNCSPAGMKLCNGVIETKTKIEDDAQSAYTAFDTDVFIKAKALQDVFTFSIWDYGGQQVFYSMHHLFLTKSGVYVVVFDMREVCHRMRDLEPEFELDPEIAVDPESQTDPVDYIKFWLSSIRMHAPDAPVLILGAFMDQVDHAEMQTVNNILIDELEIVQKFLQVVKNDEEGLVFFPVSNKTSTGFDRIRSQIQKCAQTQTCSNPLVPIRWLQCYDMIMTRNQDKPWISLSEARHCAEKCDIISVTEIEDMLSLFHELGIIIYFKGTTPLKNVITISPQWLIDSLSQVIRNDRWHKFDLEKAAKNLGLLDDVQELFNAGLLTRDVSEYLWEDKTDFFLDLMRELLLIIDWEYDGETKYLIPSLVFNRLQIPYQDSLLESKGTDGLRCIFDFSDCFLPKGVFERLICLCVAYGKSNGAVKTPELDYYLSTVWINYQGKVGFQKIDNIIVLNIHNVNVSEQISFPLVFAAMLRKVNEESMSGNLSWVLKLEADTGFVPYETAKERNIKPWFLEIPMSKKAKDISLSSFIESL